MTPFDLFGRVAVVTGGNGGIGLGMAKGLAAAGAAVAVAARNAKKGEAAAAMLAASGTRSAFVAFDVADEGSCRAMIEETVARFGRLDILINNAGTSIRKPPESYTATEWHSVLDTNLTGALFCSQAAYPAIKQAGGGKIITSARCIRFSAPATVQLTQRARGRWSSSRSRWPLPGPRTTSRLTRYCPAGSTPNSPRGRAAMFPSFTIGC